MTFAYDLFQVTADVQVTFLTTAYIAGELNELEPTVRAAFIGNIRHPTTRQIEEGEEIIELGLEAVAGFFVQGAGSHGLTEKLKKAVEGE